MMHINALLNCFIADLFCQVQSLVRALAEPPLRTEIGICLDHCFAKCSRATAEEKKGN